MVCRTRQQGTNPTEGNLRPSVPSHHPSTGQYKGQKGTGGRSPYLYPGMPRGNLLLLCIPPRGYSALRLSGGQRGEYQGKILSRNLGEGRGLSAIERCKQPQGEMRPMRISARVRRLPGPGL